MINHLALFTLIAPRTCLYIFIYDYKRVSPPKEGSKQKAVEFKRSALIIDVIILAFYGGLDGWHQLCHGWVLFGKVFHHIGDCRQFGTMQYTGKHLIFWAMLTGERAPRELTDSHRHDAIFKAFVDSINESDRWPGWNSGVHLLDITEWCYGKELTSLGFEPRTFPILGNALTTELFGLR